MKSVALSLCLLLALFFVHCGVNIFSDSEDVKLGRELDEEIRKNPAEYPILQGRPDVKEYVQQIGNKVLTSPAVLKRGVYAYQFEVIHDDKTINAFCTPGGYVYVYTGLMKFLDNEAALAGVIGHEIGHAEKRHATKRLTKYYGVQVLLGLVLGNNPSTISEIAANLFTNAAFLANSRSDENESDEMSVSYLNSTEYYPGGVRYFFEKIQKEKGSRSNALTRFLSTHPDPEDRLQHVQELVSAKGGAQAGENNLFSARYKAFQGTLP